MVIKVIEKMEKVLHFSVGSAATNTHVSTDLHLESESILDDLTKVMEIWEKTKIARNQYDMRRK